MTTQELMREERFQRYTAATVNYNAAIEAAGDTPWHEGDIDARRELFERRYTRPTPPKGLYDPISTIRGDHKRWSPVTTTESAAA